MNIFPFLSQFPRRIKKSRILSGALLLTAAGMISRIIGFFYRIFLSRTFGAENIGIYQLISPVMALAYSLSVAGFQTAISRITATTCAAAGSAGSYAGKQKIHSAASPSRTETQNRLRGRIPQFYRPCRRHAVIHLLSLCISCFVYFGSEEIAARFLLEERCAPLLKFWRSLFRSPVYTAASAVISTAGNPPAFPPSASFSSRSYALPPYSF